MKKILSVFVVLMIFSSVVFARRMNDPAASGVAVLKSGTTFKLFYKGAEQTNVKVSIINADNKILFSEVLRKVDGFVRPYNFANLPEGDYSIEISDKSGKQIEKVSYTKGKVERIARLQKVSGTDAKFLLTVLNKHADDITVSIFDSSDNVIYKHKETVTGDFARVYNLEKFSGSFTFQVTDGNGISKSFSY